jgi:hypothetical protein
MSSVLYQYAGCSLPISGPEVLSAVPVVFIHVSPQGFGLPRCNLVCGGGNEMGGLCVRETTGVRKSSSRCVR